MKKVKKLNHILNNLVNRLQTISNYKLNLNQ